MLFSRAQIENEEWKMKKGIWECLGKYELWGMNYEGMWYYSQFPISQFYILNSNFLIVFVHRFSEIAQYEQ